MSASTALSSDFAGMPAFERGTIGPNRIGAEERHPPRPLLERAPELAARGARHDETELG